MNKLKFFAANVLPLIFSAALYLYSLVLYANALFMDNTLLQVLVGFFTILPLAAVTYFAVELKKKL